MLMKGLDLGIKGLGLERIDESLGLGEWSVLVLLLVSS